MVTNTSGEPCASYGGNEREWRAEGPDRQRHAYRYLQFEVIPMKPHTDISHGPLEETWGFQNQNKLEISWKGALRVMKENETYSFDFFLQLYVKPYKYFWPFLSL